MPNADALSRSPQAPAPEEGIAEAEVQVAAVGSRDSGLRELTITDLLEVEPAVIEPPSFAEEQRKDPRVLEVINLLESGELPVDEQRARKLALQENLYVIVEGVLYHLDPSCSATASA